MLRRARPRAGRGRDVSCGVRSASFAVSVRAALCLAAPAPAPPNRSISGHKNAACYHTLCHGHRGRGAPRGRGARRYGSALALVTKTRRANTRSVIAITGRHAPPPLCSAPLRSAPPPLAPGRPQTTRAVALAFKNRCRYGERLRPSYGGNALVASQQQRSVLSITPAAMHARGRFFARFLCAPTPSRGFFARFLCPLSLSRGFFARFLCTSLCTPTPSRTFFARFLCPLSFSPRCCVSAASRSHEGTTTRRR